MRWKASRLGQRSTKAVQSHGHAWRGYWVAQCSSSRFTRLGLLKIVGDYRLRAERVLNGQGDWCCIVLVAALNLLTCICRVWRHASTGGEKTCLIFICDACFRLFRLIWHLSGRWLGHWRNHCRILGELKTQSLVGIAALCGSLTVLSWLYWGMLRFSARTRGFFSWVQELAVCTLVAGTALEETAQFLTRLAAAHLRVLKCAELVRAFRIVSANLV